MLVMATPAELTGAPTLNGLRSQTGVTATIELKCLFGRVTNLVARMICAGRGARAGP
jgi:hypothetical protein